MFAVHLTFVVYLSNMLHTLKQKLVELLNEIINKCHRNVHLIEKLILLSQLTSVKKKNNEK